jgi:small-conductance mechanosensitive channel
MIDRFADSWIDIKVWFFFNPNKWMSAPEIVSLVNETIFNAFKKQWIVIPYPHTVLTVDKWDKNLLQTAMFLINKVKKIE